MILVLADNNGSVTNVGAGDTPAPIVINKSYAYKQKAGAEAPALLFWLDSLRFEFLPGRITCRSIPWKHRCSASLP